MQNASSFTAACMQCFVNPETSTYVAEVYKVLQPAVDVVIPSFEPLQRSVLVCRTVRCFAYLLP